MESMQDEDSESTETPGKPGYDPVARDFCFDEGKSKYNQVIHLGVQVLSWTDFVKQAEDVAEAAANAATQAGRRPFKIIVKASIPEGFSGDAPGSSSSGGQTPPA